MEGKKMKYNPGLEEMNRIWDDGKEGKAAIITVAAIAIMGLAAIVAAIVLL